MRIKTNQTRFTHRVTTLSYQKGLSSTDLAHKMGVTQPMVTFWTDGTTKPNIKALADALGVYQAMLTKDMNKTCHIKNDKESFSNFINRQLVSKKFSITLISQKLGVKYHTVHAWTTGKSTPSAKHIPALARMFNVEASKVAELVYKFRYGI
jgi:ribosome-binding protein aMBF1 (putative translation factor)